MNDNDRSDWIDESDEMAEWFNAQQVGDKWRYIRKHRAEVDAAIEAVQHGKKPPR